MKDGTTQELVQPTDVAKPAPDALDDVTEPDLATVMSAPKKKKSKKKKAASGLPEKDIQTWFRLTSRNLYTRRRQLDTKANILLSVNAVMLTLTAGTVYPNIDGQIPQLIAMMPVSLANLTAMFLAVRAMRPHIPLRGGTFDKSELTSARLTTFDGYYRMPETMYVSAVEEVLKNQDFIHDSLIKDIYHLGILLAKRYALLELAYKLFIWGVLTSAFLFALTEVLTRQGVFE